MPRIVREAAGAVDRHLVCIAGCSQSGKTLAATRMVRWLASLGLSADLLSMDDFWRPSDSFDFTTVAEGFDHPDAVDLALLNRVLYGWSQGARVRLPTLAYERTSTGIPRSRRQWGEPTLLSPIVIAEGLFVHYELISQFAAASLLIIGPPADLRFLRRLRRDMLSRGYEETGVRSVWDTMTEPGCRRHILSADVMKNCRVDYFVDGTSYLPSLQSE